MVLMMKGCRNLGVKEPKGIVMTRKVEEQKGPIRCNTPPTLNQMTYPERVADRKQECAMRRSAQTLTLHEPKTSKR